MSVLLDSLPHLPERDPRGHKGTFGRVAVIGGCAGPDIKMVGAPALAALGALRAGCGLARLYCPRGVLETAMAVCPSCTGVELPVEASGAVDLAAAAPAVDRALGESDALVIGPGLGVSPSSAAMALRSVQQEDVPVIVDADAINALAGVVDLHLDFRARAVLTPHPGEFKRLAASLRIALDPVDPGTRPTAAAELAQRLGCVVVLKGAGTVVSDGQRTWICGHRESSLATAGTGDVLSGAIAGVAAQFCAGPRPVLGLLECAALAVEAHARAAAAWSREHGGGGGLLAAELAACLPGAFSSLRSGVNPAGAG